MSAALAGLVILVLGDSHMATREGLILGLHEALVANGASVHSFGMCGASPDEWLLQTTVACGRAERHDATAPILDFSGKPVVTWSLNDLLQKYHPGLVIAEMGDAVAGYGAAQMAKPWVYDQVHNLTGRIAAAGASCVWVGPAWGQANANYFKTDARVREVSDFLAKSVAPCAFIDSTAFSRPGQWPTTDGQHLTPAGYRQWGADIANAVVRLRSQNLLH